MRILFSLDNFDHGTGGAEMSARALAWNLAERGHQVEVLQRDRSIRTHMDGPVRVQSHPLPMPRLVKNADRDTLRWNAAWRRILDAHLADRPADLVVTQQRLLSSSVDVARARDLPVVAFVRAYGMFCPNQFRRRDPLRDCDLACRECFGWHQRLGRGAIRRNLEAYRRGLERASLVIANSRYVQQVIRKLLGLEAAVVYPFTDLDRYRSDDGARDRVLFVKPQYVKGLPIAIEIAQRMPDTRFLIAGKPRRRARRAFGRLPNVELAGWVSDMRSIYARTRVLLGPSIWPEPFGRVFVEAGAAGIPSVGSARGGIPEAIGDGGLLVERIFEIDHWVEALRRLEDPRSYADYSAKARAHAQRFSLSQTAQDFIESVRSATGVAL